MDRTVSLEEERRWRETAPELRIKGDGDDDRPWFCYLVQFACDGREWGTEIWAHDHADAERRLEIMKRTGRVLGQRMSSVPA
jgi:hypothetical protein